MGAWCADSVHLLASDSSPRSSRVSHSHTGDVLPGQCGMSGLMARVTSISTEAMLSAAQISYRTPVSRSLSCHSSLPCSRSWAPVGNFDGIGAPAVWSRPAGP